jgi:hypothetical protein
VMLWESLEALRAFAGPITIRLSRRWNVASSFCITRSVRHITKFYASGDRECFISIRLGRLQAPAQWDKQAPRTPRQSPMLR